MLTAAFSVLPAGQLWLEELLYHELIEIYRSPERLLALTRLPKGAKWGGVGNPPAPLLEKLYEDLETKKNQ